MKKVLLLSVSFFIMSNTFAQQKIEKHYFDQLGIKTDSVNAVTSSHYIFSDTITGAGVLKKFDKSGKLIIESYYSNLNIKNSSIDRWTRHGTSKIYNPSGYLQIIENYKDDKLNGELVTYYKDKSIRRKDIFKNNTFVEGQCFDEKGNEIEHFDYFIHPEYEGGVNAIYSHVRKQMRYPELMQQQGISDKVYVQFTISKEGALKNIRVNKSKSDLFKKEAIRVVSLMKNWIPGSRDGEKIDVKYTLPISFKVY
ncbi:TonB family protein [Aureibaculum sp. A20]|uniref:TonB family protein n=1 Tax=Aureibaculum flavum TaxID=2795986 RepID=A0ABS0WRC3_9FLAO|nr:energy transducer TonB [Aureibaculum flavum]MBJ2174534.1 TonB family protein [Aureibaculum flavum]